MNIFSKFFGGIKPQEPKEPREDSPVSFKTCSLCKGKVQSNSRFCPYCGWEFKQTIDQFDCFISYRRETGKHVAPIIKLELEKFNKAVFMDVDEMQTGKFDEQLKRRIQETPNFILMLTPGCLDRCANKIDWLKQEIVHAFETARNIIPVIVDKFAYPDAKLLSLLPDCIHCIETYHAVFYNETDRSGTIRKIMGYLKTLDAVPRWTEPTSFPELENNKNVSTGKPINPSKTVKPKDESKQKPEPSPSLLKHSSYSLQLPKDYQQSANHSTSYAQPIILNPVENKDRPAPHIGEANLSITTGAFLPPPSLSAGTLLSQTTKSAPCFGTITWKVKRMSSIENTTKPIIEIKSFVSVPNFGTAILNIQEN